MNGWQDDLDGPSDEPSVEEPGEPAPALYYGCVDEFVRVYLRHIYRRAINGRNRRWAAAWWKYPEAVARLEALWLSWEELRRSGPVGPSVWWKDHADYHMAVMMDPDGPFYNAADGDQNRNQAGQPLPYEPPPEGMFPPEPHIYREPAHET